MADYFARNSLDWLRLMVSSASLTSSRYNFARLRQVARVSLSIANSAACSHSTALFRSTSISARIERINQPRGVGKRFCSNGCTLSYFRDARMKPLSRKRRSAIRVAAWAKPTIVPFGLDTVARWINFETRRRTSRHDASILGAIPTDGPGVCLVALSPAVLDWPSVTARALKSPIVSQCPWSAL